MGNRRGVQQQQKRETTKKVRKFFLPIKRPPKRAGLSDEAKLEKNLWSHRMVVIFYCVYLQKGPQTWQTCGDQGWWSPPECSFWEFARFLWVHGRLNSAADTEKHSSGDQQRVMSIPIIPYPLFIESSWSVRGVPGPDTTVNKIFKGSHRAETQ